MSSFSALQNHSSIIATTSSAISIRSAVYAGKKAGVKTKRRAEESLKTKKRFQQKSIQETLLNTATSWTALPLRDPDADLTSLPLRKAAKPLPQFTPEDFSVKEEKYAKQVKSGTRVEEENEDEEEYGAEEYEGPLEECEGEGEGFPISGKGVPAVMRCFDTAKIYVKAGDGGNGIVAFRREKYVPLGGPAGGNGGRGGNVYMEVDSSMNSLLSFRKGVHFRAGNGNHGQGRCQDGAKGQDIVVRVAPGTVVRNSADGDVLAELTTLGQRVMVLGGGRGGRGNASFKTMKNKAPQIAENGEEGSEMWLDLELKLVADVGIIGVPNAGKSTLLSVISAAKPTIADYPFTTLLPNLGVVSLDYHASMVVADLPGLLEGAHRGYGLGHEFLRHIERCHALVYVVDGSSCQPEYEFDAVRLELDLFSPELAQKPFVVAFNKMDIPEAAERWATFRKTLEQRGIQPLCMSAVTKTGTKEVVYAAYELLKKRKERLVDTQDNTGEVKDVGMLLRKNKDSRLDDFEIKFDNETNTWSIHGAGLERFIQMTNWEYLESFKRFQHVLEACGVERALRQRGIKEGDSVFVGQMELEWHDKKDFSNLVDRRRYSRGSRSWPH